MVRRRQHLIGLTSLCALILLFTHLCLFVVHMQLSEDDDYNLPASVLAESRFPYCKKHHLFGRPLNTQEEQNAWSGNVPDSVPPYSGKFSLFASIYKHPLNWLPDYLGNYVNSIKNITIISKWRDVDRLDTVSNLTEALGLNSVVPPIHWMALPNVGRCDHSYAYWLSTQHGSIQPHEVYLFIKDNIRLHQKNSLFRPLEDVLRIASSTGFACAQGRWESDSPYHITRILRTYQMTKYKNRDQNGYHNNTFFKSVYSNLGEWQNHMGIKPPQPLTLVCYGGMFAVRGDRLLHPPGAHEDSDVFSRIAKSLSRADSLEEGHFAERSWGALFATPLDPLLARSLLQHATNLLCLPTSMKGPLHERTFRESYLFVFKWAVRFLLVVVLANGLRVFHRRRARTLSQRSL